MRTLAAIVVALLLGAPAGVASNTEAEWLDFRPFIVKLTGRFEIVLRFRPPNYGEDPRTDLEIEVPMLVLPSEVNCYEFLDKEVVARGKPSHATRGPEFSPVIMDLKRIAPVH